MLSKYSCRPLLVNAAAIPPKLTVIKPYFDKYVENTHPLLYFLAHKTDCARAAQFIVEPSLRDGDFALPL